MSQSVFSELWNAYSKHSFAQFQDRDVLQPPFLADHRRYSDMEVQKLHFDRKWSVYNEMAL